VAAAAAGLHELAPAQARQVIGQSAAGHPERINELGDAVLALGQRAEHRQPGRIGQHLEEPGLRREQRRPGRQHRRHTTDPTTG